MIILKASWEIDLIRKASRIVAEALAELRKLVQPGITTLELDAFTEAYILKRGAKPAFKGYRGYPYTLCVSVNEEIVHGLPGRRRLQEGDIIGLDLGAIVDGYYGDGALTLPVGGITEEARRLMAVTEQCLKQAILKARVGNHLSDISHAVQSHAESQGYSVVRAFVGHGIGCSLHEEPQVPNFGPKGRGPILKLGMVLAIEPMVNVGSPSVRILDDGWTAVSADGSLSAHFEHTVAITENGAEVLTVMDSNGGGVADAEGEGSSS
ncbi:MAG: type I methionyl aminopeptidase [candidate division NC10 bacterium]|nr:type I methionyl aminopeptidase [candidate division NC10 bacterium]